MKKLTGALMKAVCVAGAVGAVPAVCAQEGPSTLNQRFWLQVGAFHPSIDSNVQLNNSSSGLAGTDVSFEDDLGLAKRKTLPTLLLGARLGENWRAEFEYFSLKRNAFQNVLTAPITFNGTTYQTSASLATDFSSKVYRLSAGYSFYRTPQVEVGAVLGVHVTDFNIALLGNGSVDGSVVATRREQKDKTVPLPTIGAYGTYAFAPSWMASGRVDLLSLKVRDYKGELLNLQANLLYRFTPEVAIGVGYRYDDYTLKSSRSELNGKVEYTFSGPQVILDAGF